MRGVCWVSAEHRIPLLSALTGIDRENSDTRKIIPTLLQPSVASLAPDIIAVYIQSVAKIFGTWVVQLAQTWDDDTDLPEVRRVADSIVEGIQPFASNPDFEVQERVRTHLSFV